MYRIIDKATGETILSGFDTYEEAEYELGIAALFGVRPNAAIVRGIR